MIYGTHWGIYSQDLHLVKLGAIVTGEFAYLCLRGNDVISCHPVGIDTANKYLSGEFIIKKKVQWWISPNLPMVLIPQDPK